MSDAILEVEVWYHNNPPAGFKRMCMIPALIDDTRRVELVKLGFKHYRNQYMKAKDFMLIMGV
jgi:hypothetical protein